MKHQIVQDKNNETKQQIDSQLRIAKKTNTVHISNLFLKQIPDKVLEMKKLRIIDISFNNIEEIPESIKEFENLEALYINNNPLQYLPIEISECKKLQVLNLAYTYVKYLPREMAELKKLYFLDLTGCPLKNKLKDANEHGIVAIFQYLQRKLDRAIYREMIVKKLKEWVYMGNTYDEIQNVMQLVMDNLKDVETQTLKRLYRNLTNIFPIKIEDVDAQIIRKQLFSSLVKTQTQEEYKQQNTEIKTTTIEKKL